MNSCALELGAELDAEGGVLPLAATDAERGQFASDPAPEGKLAGSGRDQKPAAIIPHGEDNRLI